MTTMTPARSTAAPAPGPACAADPELMFPLVESERAWRPTPGEAAAQAVCARCPVLAQCRRDVLAGEPVPYGVAGGPHGRRPARDPGLAAARNALPHRRRHWAGRRAARRDAAGRGAGFGAGARSPAVIPGPDLETAIARGDGGPRPPRTRRRSGEGPRARPRAPPARPPRAGRSRWRRWPCSRAAAKVSPAARDAGRELHPARALARPARGRCRRWCEAHPGPAPPSSPARPRWSPDAHRHAGLEQRGAA